MNTATVEMMSLEINKAMEKMREESKVHIKTLIESRIEPMERQLMEQMRQHDDWSKENKGNCRKTEASQNKPKNKWNGDKDSVFTDFLMDMQVWAGSMSDIMWDSMREVEQTSDKIDEYKLKMAKRFYGDGQDVMASAGTIIGRDTKRNNSKPTMQWI